MEPDALPWAMGTLNEFLRLVRAYLFTKVRKIYSGFVRGIFFGVRTRF